MKKQTVILFFILLIYTPKSQAEDYLNDFKFSKGDGFLLFIYDNNLIPDQNHLLMNFHNKEYVIDGEGEINLGALGTQKIAERDLQETNEILMTKFKPYGKKIQLVIIPLIRVILRGEFGQAGMYRFSPNTSFWDVISEAGGLSNSLQMEEMYVIRQNEIIYKDFYKALQNASSLRELGIQSGDEIIAPRINRISFDAIMRYVNFFASLILLVLAINQYNRK